jgi:starch phosphorylase
MNGALTIGTLDGANIEIREAVGGENFFLFGLTADEVKRTKADGYDPRRYVDADDELRNVLTMVHGGAFSPSDPGLFRPLIESLWYHDEYLVLADYRSYMKCQDDVDNAYRDQDDWTRRSILNVARIGRFSSDRSIREYAEKIWGVRPVRVKI